MTSKILGVILIVASFLIKLIPLIGVPFLGTILFLIGIYNIFGKKTTGIVMIVLGGFRILMFLGITGMTLGIGALFGTPNLISGIVLVVLGLVFVLK